MEEKKVVPEYWYGEKNNPIWVEAQAKILRATIKQTAWIRTNDYKFFYIVVSKGKVDYEIQKKSLNSVVIHVIDSEECVEIEKVELNQFQVIPYFKRVLKD